MIPCYLDTSIAVAVLEGHKPSMEWFAEAANSGALHTSRLLQTELTRVLHRTGRPLAHRERILGPLTMIPLSERVLTTAEILTPQLKTLDAIHIASALQLGSSVTVATHDRQMLRACEELGIATLDPRAADTP